MKNIKWFKRKQEIREDTTFEDTLINLILKGTINSKDITEFEAMNIPTVAGCVKVICDTVAMIPIRLFKKDSKGKITEVLNDDRIYYLNNNTGDTLDSYQFKKALVKDYLLNGAAYAYKNKRGSKIKSLHYVESKQVGVLSSPDIIFKYHKLMVQGQEYDPTEFLILTQNTRNGVEGIGIIEAHKTMLSLTYNSLIFENNLVELGGNKKGFLKTQHKLGDEAMTALKAAWKKLYANNDENVVILNNGLEFQEASNTSVEMQLNENKKTNGIEICKLFNVPPALLEGSITESEYNNFIKVAILPLLKVIKTTLNNSLLNYDERSSFYFDFDTVELLKGDIEKRYSAYELAVKNGIMQIDEVRKQENLEPLELDFIKLGLQDVLYNPKTKEIYTPNTNKTADMDTLDKLNDDSKNKVDHESKIDVKGGENDEHRD